jgi:hypothetical protein
MLVEFLQNLHGTSKIRYPIFCDLLELCDACLTDTTFAHTQSSVICAELNEIDNVTHNIYLCAKRCKHPQSAIVLPTSMGMERRRVALFQSPSNINSNNVSNRNHGPFGSLELNSILTIVI